jgi:hypothetical protein
VFDFLSNHALMLLAWADRTEEALRRRENRSAAQRDRAAIAQIKRTMAAYPPGEQEPHGST